MMVSPRDWRFYAAFSGLMTVNLMAALEASSLAVALPIITKTLYGSAIQGFWSGTGFLLASTACQPLFASFSHIFGRRQLLLVALIPFTIGSLVAGCARNFTILLIGRCFQGVGGGGIIALTSVLLTDLVPLRERGKWSCLINAMWAIGSVVGPPIGGALAQKALWRWVFLMNVPLCLVAFPTILLFLKLNHKSEFVVKKLRRVDWLGCIIFLGSATSFLIPLTWGGIMYSWNDWKTLVPLALGAVGLVGFFCYEKFGATEPLIRLSVFSATTAAVSYIGTVIQGMIVWCLVFYLPIYYEGVKGLTPSATGIAFLPFTFTIAPISVIVGILIGKVGRYNWSLWSGWALTTLSLGLFLRLDESTPTVSWIFISLATGIGIGILYAACFFAVQAGTAHTEDLAFSAAMSGLLRTFGQALGVCLGGVVFQNQFKHELMRYPELAPQAGAYSKDASALIERIRTMKAGTHLKTELVRSLSGALHTVWIVMCALSALALLLSLFSKDSTLDREFVSEQTLRQRGEA